MLLFFLNFFHRKHLRKRGPNQKYLFQKFLDLERKSLVLRADFEYLVGVVHFENCFDY